MAVEILLKKGNIVKESYLGFSWTTFFFGGFVPLFRGDYLAFLIMIVAQCFTFNLANIIFCFIYNKIYTRNLIEKYGFEPANESSSRLLEDYCILRNYNIK